MLRGENQPRAKLTQQQVDEIRELLASGATHLAIAQQYGISRPTVTSIHSGRSWADPKAA